MAITTQAERQLVLRGYSGVLAGAAGGSKKNTGTLMMMGVGLQLAAMSLIILLGRPEVSGTLSMVI